MSFFLASCLITSASYFISLKVDGATGESNYGMIMTLIGLAGRSKVKIAGRVCVEISKPDGEQFDFIRDWCAVCAIRWIVNLRQLRCSLRFSLLRFR